MRKIKRLVLHGTTQVLSHNAMKSLLGGSNETLIYWCICSNEDGSKMDARIKVYMGVNPETAVLNKYCQKYTSANCVYKESI